MSATIAPQTLVYKQISTTLSTIDVNLDIYSPAFVLDNGTTSTVPAVVYFHGGGLTVGNRQSWFPNWLHRHDIVKDLQDVLEFVTSREFASTSTGVDGLGLDISPDSFKFKVDPQAVAVAGSSAGGLCAYLAAMHCISPKPKAIVSMYGMGGDFIKPHYLTPKTKPFFRGREILDPRDFLEYLHPNHSPENTPDALVSREFSALQPIADSPLEYHPQTYHIPGYPANRRMLITRLYLQLGIFIDYFTGAHENGGISTALRGILASIPALSKGADDVELNDRFRTVIPEQHRSLFPQFGISAAWPPVVLVHGTDDSAVPIGDSRTLAKQLKASGVDVELWEIEGREHSFDYEPEAEELFGDIFDKVGEFLKTHIGRK
ncbi:hypothetical protein H0H87_002659 [Tephrocybe sp. NHM501043]|nr:hypothetical protein H0H87_002659 [Tephrocybe sp. NHM501043]